MGIIAALEQHLGSVERDIVKGETGCGKVLFLYFFSYVRHYIINIKADRFIHYSFILSENRKNIIRFYKTH